jgi:triacylglycerol lipase
LADLDARKVKYVVGKVHRGFRDALTPVSSRVLQFALERSHHAGRRLHLIGHSLGGALATITAGCLVARPHEIVVDSLVTFGAPRAGDREFADWLTEKLGDRCYRFERCCDVVPRLPRFSFAPVDGRYYFDANGQPYFNPGWLFMLCDRIRARLRHFGVWGTAGIDHHSIDDYADVVRTAEERGQLWTGMHL